MTKNIYIMSLALFVFGCSKENPVGYVGQPVSATISVPDESEDLEFLWELTNIPSNSYLINSDIQAGSDNYSIIFIPDVIGVYSIEASVFQYNDEIETQSFTFNIIEGFEADTSSISKSDQISLDTLALTELLTSNDNEPDWYDTYEDNNYLNSSALDTVSIKNEQTSEQKMLSTPPKRAAIKKKKPKGQSIPFDKDRFTIQIASKKKLDDAKKVAAKLIESGYDAYIQKANFKESNEVWFRVRVGSYDNRQTASAVAESLSMSQRETAWVDFVRYEN